MGYDGLDIKPDSSVMSILLLLQMLLFVIIEEKAGIHRYLTWRYSAISFWQLATLKLLDDDTEQVSRFGGAQ